MSKTIGKDSVVIITTKQAETINKVHSRILDSIYLLRGEAYDLAYYKLEAIDKIDYLEQSLEAYKRRLIIKDKELEILRIKRKNPMLVTMLLLVGWTLYTGIHTQTLK
jgi:hypothetical protein